MFKKGLLSLAAITALSTSLFGSGATYLPLTSATHDDHWIMFGVNGFKVDGATPATNATFVTTGKQLTDSGGDDVSTSGISDTNGNGALVELKALNLSTGALSSVTVNIDVTGIIFSETEPVRSMYIKAGGNSNADVLLKYKASLEGKTVEFKINGDSTVYTTTINALNTYDNPATRTLKSASSAVGGNPLNTISEAVDYNFLDNPLNPADYNSVANAVDSHAYQTPSSSAKLRMYAYNANTGSWEIYDRANSELANDFDILKLGKAYWAKMDLNGDGTSDAVTKAGLVLGTSDLNNTSYSGELAPGWDLMSFDGAKPDIRTSSTGLILTDAKSGGTITIADTTGINMVSVTLSGSSVAADAKAINMAVEAQKDLGNIPDTFNLRAFGSDEGGNNQLILISNKRFSLEDNAGTFSNATSLAGKDIWDMATENLKDYSATALPAASFVRCVYGESALVLKPLVGNGTASHLDHAVNGGGNNASAKIQVGTLNPVALADATTDADTTLATAISKLKTITETGYKYNAVSMDFNNDGTDDYALLSADKTFYIRDYTFTRVMEYDNTGAGTFKITSPNPAIITTGTLTQTVTNINSVADVSGSTTNTGVYAAEDGTKIVFVSSVDLSNNFNVIDDTTNDYLTDATSSNPIAKGAVEDVYSLNALAKQAVVPHIVKLDIDEVTDDAGDKVKFSLNGTAGTEITSGVIAANGDAYKAMFDAYVTQIRADVKATGLDAVVSHDFTYSGTDATALAAALDAATITISGYDVASAGADYTSGGGTDETDIADSDTYDVNKATFGTFTATPAKLTDDLKYNAIYTPDYATDGPLYTLKDLGYTAKAMITGTANMTSGNIAWDSLDLTQSPTEWFKNQNFNLYSIDGKAGYWVYLENSNGTNPISVDNSTIHPSYTYQFNKNGTTNNRVAATLQITVHGIPADTTPVSVYANVGGSKVELNTLGTNGIYTGSISSYEVNGLTAGSLYGITLSVADGTGYKRDNIAIGSIDFKKPAAPSIILGTGLNTELNSTSSDTTGYYIYDVTTTGSIPEENTNASSTKIAKILDANASSYNLCAAAATFGTTYTYRAIALDGNASSTGAGSDAELGFGNASDATEFTYTPTLKGADLLINTQGVDTAATSLATPYTTSCVALAQRTQNTGISLKSIKADRKVKMSYIKKDNVSFSTDTPYTIYVGTTSDGVAEVKYVPAYANSQFFIEIDGVVYTGTLPANDSANGNSSSALVVSTKVENETLPN